MGQKWVKMPKKKKAKISQERVTSLRKFFWLAGTEIEGSLIATCETIGTSRASAYTPKKEDQTYSDCLDAVVVGMKDPTIEEAEVDGLSPALAYLRKEHPELFDRWRMQMIKTFKSDGAEKLLEANVDLENVHVSSRAREVVKQLQKIRQERLLKEEEEMALYSDQDALMGAAITTVELNQAIMRRAIASFSSLFRNGRCSDTVSVTETYGVDKDGNEYLSGKRVKRTHSSRDPDIGDLRRAIGTLGPLLESMTGLVASGILPQPVVLELYRSMRVFQDGAAAATAKYNKIQHLMDAHGEDVVVGHLEQMLGERTTEETTVITEGEAIADES